MNAYKKDKIHRQRGPTETHISFELASVISEAVKRDSGQQTRMRERRGEGAGREGQKEKLVRLMWKHYCKPLIFGSQRKDNCAYLKLPFKTLYCKLGLCSYLQSSLVLMSLCLSSLDFGSYLCNCYLSGCFVFFHTSSDY